jgi:hypothetical protein
MRYVLPIALSLTLATGADGALYAFANRYRPPTHWGCLVDDSIGRREGQFRHDAIMTSALIVNLGAIACVGTTLLRRRRDCERERMFPLE